MTKMIKSAKMRGHEYIAFCLYDGVDDDGVVQLLFTVTGTGEYQDDQYSSMRLLCGGFNFPLSHL